MAIRSIALLALLLPCLAAAAPPVEIGYYDVQGSDFGSLVAALNSRGRFHGDARWNISYEYRRVEDAGRCRVETLTPRLALTMTLPRWSPPPGAAADLVARWERYLAALRVHEEGHLEQGRSFEAALRPALGGLSAPTCPELDAAVHARFQQMLEEYHARDLDYDARTGHGKTQGAYFQ